MQNKPLLTLLASTAIAVTAALSVPTAAFTASTSSNKARSSGIARTAPSTPSTATNARPVRANGIYVVRMAGQPAATYNGRIKGFAATRPAAGERFDADRASSYRDFLRSRQDAAIAKVGGRVVYNYDVAFNGVAAELTEAQAEKLASMPGVLSVMKDQLHSVDTSSTPAFLGLYSPNGLWALSGGARSTGNNVVVGIIDSGIVPENPSFANVDNRPRGHGGKHNKFKGAHSYAGGNTLADWTGICEDGEEFSGSAACNGKIIGARYFNEAWGGDEGIDAQRPWEFNSPRDYDGHGTHTAATAAGGYKVKPTGPAAVFGAVSGMAPGARIAAYKALWAAEDGSTANGFTSDLVAAIDQAVADGVDVINYSVSGSVTSFRDPVEIAFLYAADAGVFVAASAGNSGPTASTVAHPSPWITTVAAGTHNREVSGRRGACGAGQRLVWKYRSHLNAGPNAPDGFRAAQVGAGRHKGGGSGGYGRPQRFLGGAFPGQFPNQRGQKAVPRAHRADGPDSRRHSFKGEAVGNQECAFLGPRDRNHLGTAGKNCPGRRNAGGSVRQGHV